jgi:trans-aconitate methyltransferase
MSTMAPTQHVLDYYDEHIVDKVADFVDGNRRVDAAWRTIQAWAPPSPSCIVEIGCGVGAMAYRMAARWPDARVIGVDISPRSIEFAKRLFQLPNLSYANDDVRQLGVEGQCDLVVFVDVYEHVARGDRAAFHAAVAPLLAGNGRLVMTFPTPAHLQLFRETSPEELQPVDEDVDLTALLELSAATSTSLLMFQAQDIWLTGDYAHAVFGRREMGRPVERPAPPDPTLLERVVRKARTLLYGTDPESREARLERVLRTLGAAAYRPK